MKKAPLFAALLLALIAAGLLLRTPDTDPQEMLEKYTNAESEFVENGEGLRVHYRDQGNPDGLPIVLVHGTSASLHTWEPLVEELGDEYRLVTLTLPGHGLSSLHPDEDYGFSGYEDAVALVTAELGLERFVLGGNSLGGWIAWRYALARPDEVDALLLLNAAGSPLRPGEEPAPMGLGFRLASNPVGRYILTQVTPRSLVRETALASVSVKSVMDDAAVDRYWELLRLPGNRHAAVMRTIDEREAGAFDRIGEIEQPALVIWGEEDQFIHASAALTFDENMQDAQIVIYDGIGHLPMEEAPEATAADIDAFLDARLRTVSPVPY
ncbi:MAG: alpha/beta hydrolase [Pseudomonadota bacterium]